MINKLKQAFEFAKVNKLPWVEVDGIKIPVPQEEIVSNDEQQTKEMKMAYNPEPELTDEEVLYYATPYFDELQTRKKAQIESKHLDEDLRG